ncbi:50S ribosomal protein L18 [Acidobacteria bacterium AB60]|nr:50S ribosomal protein L18 [Acidobacteria bacterium AB60]
MINRSEIRKRIHVRIRRKLSGTTERPRLSVHRSLNHIYAQVIDDATGETVASASTLAAKSKTGGNIAAAREVGKSIAEKAKEKGVKKVVFDRGGYLYHGRIKALADAAREAGLEF